jgi:hypothetical protein
MPTPDFQAGDELTAGNLNEWSAAAAGAGASVDGSSGLSGVGLPSGKGLRAERRPEGWFKVYAAPSGSPAGSYRIVEQVDLPGGAFADGPKVRLAYPTPGSTAPPADGSKVVRAWRDRASWRFEWGAC